MKIALITTDNRELFKTYSLPEPDFGTAPEALLQGFSELPQAEIHVLSCVREVTPAPRKLAENIYFHSLVVPKWGWMRTLFYGCSKAVRRKLQELRPNIVHGQGTENDCAISAVRSGLPNVVTIHGNMEHISRVLHCRPGSFIWMSARLENYCLRRTDGVFCNSAHTESLVKRRARRTWRVPNPIRGRFLATSAPTVNPPGKCTLVNVGVVSPYKRQIELLRVVDELHRLGFDFELLFVGRAETRRPYAKVFFEKIRPYEQRGLARYVGYKSVEELIPLFDQCSAMVHVALEESFGLVVAEALARNLRVFASKAGGVVDVASGAPGATLYELEDWAGLTKGIADWLRQGHPRPNGASETMRKRYSPVAIANRHLEIYREVLAKP